MAPPDETVKRVRCNRLPRLDLAGMQCLSPFYQQIDLAADLIAPKIDGRFLAVANPGLRARPGKTAVSGEWHSDRLASGKCDP